MSSRLVRSPAEPSPSFPRPRVFRRALRFISIFIAACALLPACGGSSAGAGRGAGSVPSGPRIARRVEAADLFPADLDLVLRVDVARMSAAIGPAAAAELSARAGLEGEADEKLLKNAMGRAAVVWIGVRLADVETGDRVIVIEGDIGGLRDDAATFKAIDTELPGVSIVDRAEPPPRAGTARIIWIGDRAAAFVSPVEVDSVARVLRDGPDERRGDPAREGIISADLRPRRLPASLERRFPSISAIIAGTKRIRAAVVPVADGVRLDAEITARNKPAADRALRFLSALRDNVEDPKSKDFMRDLSIEQVEGAIHVRWLLSAKALGGLVKASTSSPEHDRPPGE